MKYNLIVLFILTFNSYNFAQNWAPIQVGEKINYTVDNQTLHSTIWIDSIQLQNSDTLLFLNKTLKKCDQCSNSSDPWWIFGYYLLERTSFLPPIIRLKPNLTYELIGDDIELKIKPMAKLNDTWLYDSLNNIAAVMSEVSKSSIFNTIDSIKVIVLSNSDTIILSQNFGIIKFPLGNNKHVNLFGIEERDLGYSTPYFNDFFSFAVGDKFEYEYTSENRFKGPTSNVKYSITDKKVNLDTVKYQIQAKKKTIFYDFNTPYDTIYDSYIDTLIFINKREDFINKNINQPLNDLNICGNKNKPVLLGYNTTFQTKTKYYPSSSFLTYSNDTIYVTNNPNNCAYSEHAVYGVGVGLISASTSYSTSNPYTDYNRTNLIACEINGQQYGCFTPDSNFVNGMNESVLFGKLKIYPNPAFESIRVKLTGTNNTCYTLIIETSMGAVIKKDIVCEGIKEFKLEDLQIGVYFIRIFNENSSITKKIVKL